MKPRVLLFCPTNRLQRETLNAIHTLRYDGPIDTMFTRDNPNGEASLKNVLYNFQKAERLVMNEGYDYLFTVENDIIPPADALLKLMALDADIAYGIYSGRRGVPWVNVAPTIQNSYGQEQWLEQWRDLWGSVIPCAGVGFGCTLIKASCFEYLSFHSETGGDAYTQMALDAARLGLSQMADTSVVCGHKRVDGFIRWPSRDGSETTGQLTPVVSRTIKALRDFGFWSSDDKPFQLNAGDVVTVDFESASLYTGLGMAQYAEEHLT